LSKHWIKSPAWDALWIFSGLWAPLVALAVYAARGVFSSEHAGLRLPTYDPSTLAVVYLPLSILHRVGATFSVLGMPILRDEARRDLRRFVYLPAAITVASFGLAVCFAFHPAFSFLPAFPGELWAFFVLAYASILWDRWHFCAQEFGVLSIYRMRAGQRAAEDRRFDRVFTIALMLGVNMVLYVCSGFPQEKQVLLHGTPLAAYRGPLQQEVARVAIVVGVVLLLTALAREWRHPQRSFPKLGYYVLIGGHTIFLFFVPQALGLFFLSYILHHWIVAVGLFGRVGVNAYAQGSSAAGLGRLALRAVPLLALLVPWYYTYDRFNLSSKSLIPLPNIGWLNGAPMSARLLAAFAIGAFFTIDFLHYYYDRCLYRFRDPAVRERVVPLLLGQATS
jgi:hypothetical protein